jgi:hypothetical protein
MAEQGMFCLLTWIPGAFLSRMSSLTHGTPTVSAVL